MKTFKVQFKVTAMILRHGTRDEMKFFFVLASLAFCYANECMDAVQETCQEVIIENNEQLLETMEGMVANRTCDVSNFVLDEQMKDELILRLSDEFKEELLPEIKSTLKVELKAEFCNEDLVTEATSSIQNVQPVQDKVRYTQFLTGTCDELARVGIDESGEYEIDPDGANSGEAPILVTCNFTTKSTIVRPDFARGEVKLENDFSNGPHYASVDISYDAPMGQIISLLDRTTSFCKQEIVFSCNLAPLFFNNLSFAWLRNRDGANQSVSYDNIRCKCGKTLLTLKQMQNPSLLSRPARVIMILFPAPSINNKDNNVSCICIVSRYFFRRVS